MAAAVSAGLVRNGSDGLENTRGGGWAQKGRADADVLGWCTGGGGCCEMLCLRCGCGIAHFVG